MEESLWILPILQSQIREICLRRWLQMCSTAGRTVTETDLDTILPELQDIFGKLGYMETSSSDLFSQFLRMGVGAEPIIAGYESQLIEYASIYPDEYDRIRDDVVMLYPTPTVWSAHVMIALDENGQILLNAHAG